jgi:pentatricopeptide repeat protein
MQKSSERTEPSHDITFVLDAVINLYAAHVNSLLYPYDHPLISDSLKNAFHCLQEALKKKPLIQLETRDGKLMVDGEPLKGNDDVLHNFAAWLNSLKIHSLSIDNGITRRELGAFHKIISTQQLGAEELSRAMSERNIISIVVNSSEFPVGALPETSGPGNETDRGLFADHAGTISGPADDRNTNPSASGPSGPQVFDGAADNALCKDYLSTAFQMNSSQERAFPSSDPSSWPPVGESSREHAPARHVEMLLERELSDDERSVVQDIPPVEMADLLNAMLLFAPDRDMLARIAEVYFGGRRDEPAGLAADRYGIFFERLKPDLRHPLKMIVDSLFAAVGNTGVADAEARQQGTPEDVCRTQDEPAAAPRRSRTGPRRTLDNSGYVFDFIAHGNAVVHDIELDERTSACLAAPQNVSSVSEIPARVDKAADGSASAAMLIEECGEHVILTTAFEVVLELLESISLDSDLYQKLAARVTSMIDFFTKQGEFDKVLDVFNALKTQALQGRHGVHAASMIRGIFSADQFNANMAEALILHGREHREGAVRLTYALRANIVPYLLDGLSEERDTSKRRFMITLLTSVKGDVLQHVVRRLRDSRWYVQRNMLYLLRECHGRSSASAVADFLDHEVPLVRLEALSTLLSFQDPDAESHVRELLQSDNVQLQKGAVRLAGAYRIKSAVPYLLKLLEEKDLLGKKFLFKRTIIRALGRIGDGDAVVHLLSLCRSTSIVHRNDVDRLKVEIFRTLQNYPGPAVEPLLDYGIRSRNEEVAVICRKLMKRYGRPDAGKR